jgi:hypothetical protein
MKALFNTAYFLAELTYAVRGYPEPSSAVHDDR